MTVDVEGPPPEAPLWDRARGLASKPGFPFHILEILPSGAPIAE